MKGSIATHSLLFLKLFFISALWIPMGCICQGHLSIYEAAKLGKIDSVVNLISSNSRLIQAKDSNNWTALHYAANNGRSEVVRILLKNGADPDVVNAIGITPLHCAVAGNNPNCVRLILSFGGNPNNISVPGGTALHTAARFGNSKIVKLLLSMNADVLAKNDREEIALVVAVRKGQKSIYSLLVDAGSEIDEGTLFGIGPLKKVKAYLQNHPNLDLNNSNGFRSPSALHWASMGGQKEVADYLIKKGSDINLTGRLGSPIKYASQNGHTELVQLLLDRGADVEQIGIRDTETPLQAAIRNGHKEVVHIISKRKNRKK